MISEKIIINGTFESNIWHINNQVDVLPINFHFDELLLRKANKGRKKIIDFEYVIEAYKAYILILIEKYAIATIYAFSLGFKKMMENTEFLNEKKELELEKLSKNAMYIEGIQIINNFLGFIDIFEISDKYFDIIEDQIELYTMKALAPRKARKLVTFESYFKFNDFIEEYISDFKNGKVSAGKMEEFYPIILWWKITSIIPSRITEFLLVPYDCIIYKNGRIFLKLRRTMLKGRKSNETIHHTIEGNYKIDEIPITEEILELIEDYKLCTKRYDVHEKNTSKYENEVKERQLLFSYKSFIACLNRGQPLNILERFNTQCFSRLLKKFFCFVVSQKYIVIERGEEIDLANNKIERIQPTDTRHFSIMNMLLRGYEPIIIKGLAGHKRVRATCHYMDHLTEYVKCYTYSLASKIAKVNMVSNSSFMDINIENLKSKDIKFKRIFGNRSKGKRVSGGLCTYEGNDFAPCKGHKGIGASKHVGCNYYIPLDEESLLTVKKKSQVLDDNIKDEIQLLKILVENRERIMGFKERYQIAISKMQAYGYQQAEIYSQFIINGTYENPLMHDNVD